MPTLHRLCPSCRVARIASPARLCPPCSRARDAARGSPTARGLGYQYQKKRALILQRDNYTCQLCGGPATTVDHIIPRARGGDDSDENLLAACLSCNSGRR